MAVPAPSSVAQSSLGELWQRETQRGVACVFEAALRNEGWGALLRGGTHVQPVAERDFRFFVSQKTANMVSAVSSQPFARSPID